MTGGFQFAPLTSDYLVYAMITAGLVLAGLTWRNSVRRAPLGRIARQNTPMAATVVLATYLGVGLLDSIHVRLDPGAVEDPAARHHPEHLSVLDILLRPLRTRVETSYSAPLAIYGFDKETVVDATGIVHRIQPPLRHAGASLASKADRFEDIAQRTFWGLILGATLSVTLLIAVVLAIAAKRRIALRDALRALASPDATIAWRATLGTAAGLLLTGCTLASLAAEYHVLGTDKVGQDVLYLGLKSIRTGLLIGTLTTFAMLPFALVFGIVAGYFGGWIDDLIQYLYTTLSSIPGVLLIAAAVLTLQAQMDRNADSFASVAQRADLRLVALCLILGVTGWIGLCRLLRAETLKLRESEYVAAATALGVHRGRILIRHILPNTLHIVSITLALDFSGYVLAEAVLSYVGVGVDPGMVSWGNMINSARLELAREPVVWWSLLAAFLFMFVLVLAANLLADAVRDAYDPRLRGTG